MGFSELQPVAQRTLSDEAADRLKAAIRNGSLLPGTRLIERDLAERLGMSRIPIREAIQRLVEEGLVRKLPHRGAVVYIPTREEIEEISSLRVVLERFVAERVIERWSPDHERTLRQIVEEMRRAAGQRNLQQVYELDYRYHLTLWQIADHSLLLEVISSLRTRINRFLYEANSALTSSQLEMHIHGHDDLIDVLNSGDVALAQSTFMQHVLGAKERILTYCNLPEGDGHNG
ncbi:MAG: GntR family transcriptional regulator [Chloroflexi bacterium]|nr:MAG: GntR family transcriptional regulator [Chloroflexota bacterium]